MDAIGVIRILQSKYAFGTVFLLSCLTGWLYKKIVKDIQLDLAIKEEMKHSENWEMIKEESRKGNIKARIAFIAYGTNIACAFVFGGLICLVNVDV